MSIRYRLKRSSVPVHESIPAHPDAIYRPQSRPIPVNVPPVYSDVIAPRVMADNPVVAAPLAAGGSGVSPWWIIGPLLALLAAMALGVLAYTMKKKHDLKQQAEEENNPRQRETNDRKTNKDKEHNQENVDNTKKSPIDNVPLRSFNPDTTFKVLKKTIPMLSSAKVNSTSNTNPLFSNEVINDQFGKSALPVHGLPLTSNSSILSSTRSDSASSLTHHLPINQTPMAKHNFDGSKLLDEKNISKTIQDTMADPSLRSPLKNIPPVSTHKIEQNYSENLPLSSTHSPISSIASTTQKLGQSNDGSDLITGKRKPNANLNEKGNDPNDFEMANDDKSRERSANLGRADHIQPSNAGQNNKEFTLPSFPSEINNQNVANKSDGGHINQLNSPEQHGVGKSPLISCIPTGSKHSGREKLQSRTNQKQTEKENWSSESSSSNSNLQQQQNLPKENIPSNESKNPSSSSEINKDKHPSTLSTHSKHQPLSGPSETTSSKTVTSTEPRNEKNSTSSYQIYPDEKSSKHNVQPSDQYTILNKNDLDKFGTPHIHSFTKGLDSNPSDNHLQSHIDFSNPQKSTNPNDDKSDESNTSLIQSDLTNRNKRISFMPNVPQCKTNASSDDDDDYDEIYAIPPNNSPLQ